MPYIDFNTRTRVPIWPGAIDGPVAHSDKCTFGHFTIQAGADLPLHDHPHEQWTHVIEGELEFDIDGDKQTLTAGMTAYIPGGKPHFAHANTECRVIDCFMPPREDFIEMEKEAMAQANN